MTTNLFSMARDMWKLETYSEKSRITIISKMKTMRNTKNVQKQINNYIIKNTRKV